MLASSTSMQLESDKCWFGNPLRFNPIGKCSSIDEYEDIAATAAFDALHGIARVVPIEATEEMIMHAALQSNTTWAYIFRVMAARGGLTNPLEKNPWRSPVPYSQPRHALSSSFFGNGLALD
jgi:hypothetical protein